MTKNDILKNKNVPMKESGRTWGPYGFLGGFDGGCSQFNIVSGDSYCYKIIPNSGTDRK